MILKQLNDELRNKILEKLRQALNVTLIGVNQLETTSSINDNLFESAIHIIAGFLSLKSGDEGEGTIIIH